MIQIAHLLEEQCHHLGWTLLHFVWEGAIIALLFACVRCSLRSATARYVAGCCALASMVAAVAVTHTATYAPHWAPSHRLPADPFVSTVPRTDAPDTSTREPAAVAVGSVSLRQPMTLSRLERALPWIVLAWLAGVSLSSLRLLLGWSHVQFLKRHATAPTDSLWTECFEVAKQRLQMSRTIRLLKSYVVEVPTVIGWLTPVILVPASTLIGLTPAQIEMILAHELAHIRRGDYVANLLQSVVETLLFYHPAVWWVSRCVREERENCCDDLAVQACGSPMEYARALTILEELRGVTSGMAVAADGGSLLRRVQRLLRRPTETSPVGAAWIALLLFGGLVTCLAVGYRNEAPSNVSQATKTTNSVSARPSPEVVAARLKQIVLKQVGFTNVPLSEALEYLAEETRRNNAELDGICFVLRSLPPVMMSLDERIDYAVNQAAAALDGYTTDPVRARISIQPPLSNVTVQEALDAVVQAVPRPKNKLDVGVSWNGSGKLSTRIYDVHSASLIWNLARATGRDLISPRPQGTDGPSRAHHELVSALLAFFATEVNLEGPGRQLFFNDRRGLLAVHATENELAAVEQMLQKLTAAPAQVVLEVKIAEIAEDMENAAALAESFPNLPIRSETDQFDTSRTGVVVRAMPDATISQRHILLGGASNLIPTQVLSEPQSMALVKALEQRAGVDLLTMPKVTTLSRRPAVMKVGDVKHAMPPAGPNNSGGSILKLGVPVEVGPSVDVTPEVLADGYAIRLNVGASVKEFLGHGTLPGSTTPNANLPSFRVRQAATTGIVQDGQTLVFSGGAFPDELTVTNLVPVLSDTPIGRFFKTRSVKKIRKTLIFLITPTIIDPAGNRVHPPAEKLPEVN